MIPKSTYDTEKLPFFHPFLLQKGLFQFFPVSVLHTLKLSFSHKVCIVHLSLTSPSIPTLVISAVCDAD